MKVLIKNATILAPSDPLNGQKSDLLISNGFIEKIASDISVENIQVIKADNLHISSGWIDCFANFCDPGEEYKETITSGSRAAASGGFTDVMLVPNTQPVVSGKGQVEYLIQKGSVTPINILPIGAITQHTGGEVLSEMYDMHAAGAVAFSDGFAPVQSSGILQKALEYVMAIDKTIIQLPDDKTIGGFGLMNEGIVSTQIGLAGKPALSEELMIARDIEVLRYTGSKLHITGISSKKSVSLIRQAKAEGLQISCSVTPYHLFFCDEDLANYDTNLKVNPPLRTADDRHALVAAVKDGTIDFIASHHRPQDYDHKVCEFAVAKNGMETLECVFSAAMSVGISAALFVKIQTINVAQIFNLPKKEIKEGAKAALTLFIPDGQEIFSENKILSLSNNNAFIGKELTGKVIGIINKDQLFLSPQS